MRRRKFDPRVVSAVETDQSSSVVVTFRSWRSKDCRSHALGSASDAPMALISVKPSLSRFRHARPGSASRRWRQMTWRTKLPTPERKRYSAQEIATAARLPVKDVMDAIQKIGQFSDSPRRKSIEEPVRRQIHEFLNIPYDAPVPPTASGWERTGKSSPTPRDQPGSSQSGPHGGRRHAHRPTERPQPLGTSSDLCSLTMVDASWALLGFTPAEKDAWTVYLSDRQAQDAATLRNAGFAPDDLGVVLFGWTVLRRIRSGETPREVKRLLERYREAG